MQSLDHPTHWLRSQYATSDIFFNGQPREAPEKHENLPLYLMFESNLFPYTFVVAN